MVFDEFVRICLPVLKAFPPFYLLAFGPGLWITFEN